jgi:hypothetical protein
MRRKPQSEGHGAKRGWPTTAGPCHALSGPVPCPQWPSARGWPTTAGPCRCAQSE